MSFQITANILQTFLISVIWISLVILAYAPGRKFIRILKLEELTRSETLIFSISLGLGFIAFGIFLLGIVGLFLPWLMISWILILAIWSKDDLVSSWKSSPSILKDIYRFWKDANYQGKGLICISTVILILTFFQALTPVWDYDGLMYHLEGPRQFLQAGRIHILPYPHQANGPMVIEMIYSIPIGLDLVPLSKLIHLTYGVLLILATYLLGERYLGSRKGWIPAAIMIGTPLVVVLAGFAYSDLGWGLYTLLGMYSILLWSQYKYRSWLTLAGVFTGFMIGSKFLALGYFLFFTLTIIWFDRSKEWSQRLTNIFLYGGISILIGFPWYVKNWIYTGNPVYPLYFGGPGWPIERVQLYMNFVAKFGNGKSLLDYLLLPITVYLNQGRFSTFFGGTEILSPLILLVLIVPFLQNKSRYLVMIIFFTLMGFIFWALTSQQIRLLLPLLPFLCILASKAFINITSPIKSKTLRNVLIPAVVGGFLVALTLGVFNFFKIIQPTSVVIGAETREEFLDRISDMTLDNYRALKFIRNEVDENDKVIMVGNGTSFYCNGRCIPDDDFSLLAHLYKNSTDTNSFANKIRDIEGTHILISLIVTNSVDSFDSYQTLPNLENYYSLIREVYKYLQFDFLPLCAKEIYRDKSQILYELTC